MLDVEKVFDNVWHDELVHKTPSVPSSIIPDDQELFSSGNLSDCP